MATLFLGCCLVGGSPTEALAEKEEEQLTPELCSGYNPLRGDWYNISTQPGGRIDVSCPENSALFAAGFVLGPTRPGWNVQVVGRCCPLPKGVLLKEHQFSSEECPEDFVATGTKSDVPEDICKDGWQECLPEWNSAKHLLRCTKIDSSRFVLGQKNSGTILGFHLMLELGKGSYTSRGRIPLGMRYGVVRGSRYGLESGGFIGYPWGSMLTGKHGKNQFVFQPLEWKNGSQPRKIVQLYPDCLYLKDPLSPYPICVHPDGSESGRKDFPPEEIVHRHISRLMSYFSAIVFLKLRLLENLPTSTFGDELLSKSTLAFAGGSDLRKQLDEIVGESFRIVSGQICANDFKAPSPLACSDGKTPQLLLSQRALFAASLSALDETSFKETEKKTLIEMLTQFAEWGDIYEQLPFHDSENYYLSSHGFLQSGQQIMSIDARSGMILDSLRKSERLFHSELPEKLRIND